MPPQIATCQLCNGAGTVDIGEVRVQVRKFVEGEDAGVIVMCPGCRGTGEVVVPASRPVDDAEEPQSPTP